MDEAEYCHRIALMYRGKVIALGHARRTEARPRLATSCCNLNAADPLETMRALEELPGVLDVAIFGGGLHVMVDDLRRHQRPHPPGAGRARASP